MLREIILRRVRLPLIRPYVLSYRTFDEFEPILVEVRDGDGRVGWGEGHISPGSSSETRDGGWAFCRDQAAAIVGQSTEDAKAFVAARNEESKVAATALLTAVEMLEGHPLLTIKEATRLPMLTPFSSTSPKDIETEVERRLHEGFRTFKIKVGKDADADLARVKAIQRAIDGRATMRLDANRAYSEADGSRFAASLDPSGIELFEQPCHSDDWDANANVAKASTVPIMLDEPICGLDDIARAAEMENVGYCKLKLKRFGSLDALKRGLKLVRELGMEPVLGDGTSCEVQCWMEGCVARGIIRNAGEFNGFLKPKVRLFAEPLGFDAGDLVLPAGYAPTIDPGVLAEYEIASERFVAARAIAF
jgi:L-alanine-DL-glutamate epimerase-like enolase superfamily enzyme